jgi:hypothetical protein
MSDKGIDDTRVVEAGHSPTQHSPDTLLSTTAVRAEAQVQQQMMLARNQWLTSIDPWMGIQPTVFHK